MALPERKYYTFEKLAERWAEHRVTVEDLIHYCEIGELKVSIYVARCRAIAFVPVYDENNDIIDECSVGTCDISGVFRFRDKYLPDIINGETNELRKVFINSPQIISSWSTKQPRELGDLLQKLCGKWKPVELSECQKEIWNFQIIPAELVSLEGDILVNTLDLDSELFSHLKKSIKPGSRQLSYKYEQSFDFSDLRVSSDSVAMFEQIHKIHLEPSETDQNTTQEPNTEIEQNPPLETRQKRREGVLLDWLAESDLSKNSEKCYQIQGLTRTELWNSLHCFSGDALLFPERESPDSMMKKFFRKQKICYWNDYG